MLTSWEGRHLSDNEKNSNDHLPRVPYAAPDTMADISDLFHGGNLTMQPPTSPNQPSTSSASGSQQYRVHLLGHLGEKQAIVHIGGTAVTITEPTGEVSTNCTWHHLSAYFIKCMADVTPLSLSTDHWHVSIHRSKIMCIGYQAQLARRRPTCTPRPLPVHRPRHH